MKFRTTNSKLIISPKILSDWQKGGIITPTPFVMKKCIRVFSGFRDNKGISRIGYIDLDKTDPTKIKFITPRPILDIGEPGNFDDNGMILGDIIYHKKYYYMFYVGFQIPKKNKFLAFTGIAKSKGGSKFVRLKKTPILDRNNDGSKIRAIHSVIKKKNKFQFFLGEGDKIIKINNKLYPSYDTKMFEYDNFYFPPDIKSKKIIYRKNNEYRLGRPSIFKYKNTTNLLFTYDTYQKKYHYGFAKEKNGKFERCDKHFIVSRTGKKGDDKMICYPRFFIGKNNKKFIVYSGNDMGKTGLFLSEVIIINS